MKEIIDNVLKELDKSIDVSFEGDKAKFSRKGYKAYEISYDNFHRIDVDGNDVKVGFVDGGNNEIFSGGNFSLQLIRAYGCVFLGNKKAYEIKNEFFILIRSLGDSEIMYGCEMFPLKGDLMIDADDLNFSSVDDTIKDGVSRADISKMGDVARRFSELKLAEKIAGCLDEEDLIVLDGTLESKYTNEGKYLGRLYDEGIRRGVLICGLAKTTSMFTEKGNNMAGLLNSIGKDDIWYYHPVAEIDNKDHKAEMYFVKLNKRSKHVFRFEVHNGHGYKIAQIVGKLAENSNDFAFPGYPYGLILADKLARVPNKEKEYYRSLFMAKMGRKSGNMAKYLSSRDAHSILDNQN